MTGRVLVYRNELYNATRADSRAYWLVSRLLELHDDLLGGMNGRIVNGVGSILLAVLCVTGAVVWWPGSRKWRRGLTVQWRAGWQRINWDLHSALGFWAFVAVLLWAGISTFGLIGAAFAVLVKTLIDGALLIVLSRLGSRALLAVLAPHAVCLGAALVIASRSSSYVTLASAAILLVTLNLTMSFALSAPLRAFVRRQSVRTVCGRRIWSHVDPL